MPNITVTYNNNNSDRGFSHENGRVKIMHGHSENCTNKVRLKHCVAFFQTIQKNTDDHSAVAAAIAEDEAKIESLNSCCNIL